MLSTITAPGEAEAPGCPRLGRGQGRRPETPQNIAHQPGVRGQADSSHFARGWRMWGAETLVVEPEAGVEPARSDLALTQRLPEPGP